MQGGAQPVLHAAANLLEIVNIGYLNEGQVRGELIAAALGRRPGRTGDPQNPRRPMATQVRRPARRMGPTTAPCRHHPKLVTSHPALSGAGERLATAYRGDLGTEKLQLDCGVGAPLLPPGPDRSV